MILHPVFPSFIAIEQITLDNNLLEVYCKNQVSNSNQSKYLNLSEDLLKPLLEKVTYLSNEICKQIGLQSNQRVTRAWANVNLNQAIVQPHSHTKSVFSSVYYVKGSIGSGDLTFMTPINCLGYVYNEDRIKERTDFNTTEISIPPVSGTLVIFPSWLQHYVRQTNTERISIAMETNYENV